MALTIATLQLWLSVTFRLCRHLLNRHKMEKVTLINLCSTVYFSCTFTNIPSSIIVERDFDKVLVVFEDIHQILFSLH